MPSLFTDPPPSVFTTQPSGGLMARLDPTQQGNIIDRRGDTSFGPWSAIAAALADDAKFAGEKLGLRSKKPLLPSQPVTQLSNDAGLADIGTRSYPSPTKPEDNRSLSMKGFDAVNDFVNSIIYPDAWSWPTREIWRAKGSK